MSKLPTRYEELSRSEFEKLSEMHIMDQLDWLRENVDQYAAGIESLTMSGATDREAEFGVNYYWDRRVQSDE